MWFSRMSECWEPWWFNMGLPNEPHLLQHERPHIWPPNASLHAKTRPRLDSCGQVDQLTSDTSAQHGEWSICRFEWVERSSCYCVLCVAASWPEQHEHETEKEWVHILIIIRPLAWGDFVDQCLKGLGVFFVLVFFFLFHYTFVVTIYLRLLKFFCLFVCFLSVQLQQALGCCSFTSAKLPSDRQKNRDYFPIILFHFFFFLRTSLLHTVSSTGSRLERRTSNRQGESEEHSVFLQSVSLWYNPVFTRRRLTNRWLGSTFPWACTSTAVRAAARVDSLNLKSR